MSQDSSLRLLAAAIVVAGACIGAGLFFGLRARPESSLPPPNSGAPTLSRGTLPGVASPAQEPAQVVAPLSDPVLLALVTPQLAQHRRAWADQCWAPSARKNPEPATLRFSVRLGFEPSGKLLHWAVNDTDVPSRNDVAACLREKQPAISLGRGEGTRAVQTELQLP